MKKACSYHFASTFYLISLVLPLLLLGPTFAVKNSYVVYMGAHSHGTNLKSIDYERVKETHYEFLGSYLQSYDVAKDAIFYSYTRHINGFAANLEDEVANQLSKDERVVSVFLNERKELHTTRSWQFLGLHNNIGGICDNSLWKKADFGKDVIIGNLDTGAWPESESFSDNKNMGPVPSRWKGICENKFDHKFHCNRKLIGARYFNQGMKSLGVVVRQNSPRDEDGHGSHTLSTAAGNFVPGANVFGYGNGTAAGGSPSARVAAYKVCWKEGCSSADTLAAFDMAIHDGVDVLSLSMGGGPAPYLYDDIAIGSFHAVMSGIVVVCSAGNSGPRLGTVSNNAPWLLTVGASTIDRRFLSTVILGNKTILMGESLSEKSLPEKELFGIIYARDAKAENANATAAELCEAGSLDHKKVNGKILVCLRGVTARVDKGVQADLAGAIGMVLVNDQSTGNDIIADPYILPAAHISYTGGLTLLSYIKSTRSPVAGITKTITQLGTHPAPVMAAFSSNGPNIVTPEILKPDITAPGVSIIAAYTGAQGPTGEVSDKRRVLFNIMSGTSMSCPHVSGVVGLLKALHPTWSPATIKSAIITTGSTTDNNLKQMITATGAKATPFNYGGGQVQPNLAMDPGLVYDLSTTDYLDFLCASGYNQTQVQPFSKKKEHTCRKPIMRLVDLNYPSITVHNLEGMVNVTRRVKNVGTPGIYEATVISPAGISVRIEPDKLEFKSDGEEKVFNVIMQAKITGGTKDDYVFGQLTWSDNKHNVKSQIVVKQI